MVCSSCSAPNPDDAASCAHCGAAWTIAPRKRESLHGIPLIPKDAQPSGAKIANRYEIVSVLGKGGMGLVYKARDLELNDDIAIKVLQYAQEPGDAERLKREIITARKVTHANVIRIHDFGLAGDEGFVSMELLEGGTLADRLADGTLPLDRWIDVAIGICDGLAAAHAQGIVHRDIKPHNVLFDRAGIPKLADFGLARVSAATSLNIGFSGTPQYMSPEMADGREINVRSDVYSLGVLLFQMFTGELPFQADSLVRLAMMHATEPPPRPAALNPLLPRGLESIVLKALEKDPLKRYESAALVAEDLRSVKAGLEPPHAVVEASDPVALVTDTSLATPPRPQRRPSHAPRLLGLMGIAVMIAGGLVGVHALLPPSEIAATATPAPRSTQAALDATPDAATPVPAPTVLAALPPPQIEVKARPWVSVSIDGKVVAKETPCKLSVKPGKHTLTLANDDQTFRFEQPIVAVAGETLWFSADVPTHKVSSGSQKMRP